MYVCAGRQMMCGVLQRRTVYLFPSGTRRGRSPRVRDKLPELSSIAVSPGICSRGCAHGRQAFPRMYRPSSICVILYNYIWYYACCVLVKGKKNSDFVTRYIVLLLLLLSPRFVLLQDTIDTVMYLHIISLAGQTFIWNSCLELLKLVWFRVTRYMTPSCPTFSIKKKTTKHLMDTITQWDHIALECSNLTKYIDSFNCRKAYDPQSYLLMGPI